jgi:hypothetical protein
VNLKPSPLAFIVFLLAGWISRQQLIAIEYLKVENRMLRVRLNGRFAALLGQGACVAGAQGFRYSTQGSARTGHDCHAGYAAALA